VNEVDAFSAQNPICAQTLSSYEIMPFVKHYAGGLMVLGGPTWYDANQHVKMHDSWGPDDEPNTVVVHRYALDVVDEHEDVTHFVTGREAYRYFMDLVK